MNSLYTIWKHELYEQIETDLRNIGTHESDGNLNMASNMLYSLYQSIYTLNRYGIIDNHDFKEFINFIKKVIYESDSKLLDYIYPIIFSDDCIYDGNIIKINDI